MPASATTKPNTTEQGVVTNAGGILRTWGQMIDELEFAPDLRWPASVWVYNRMVSSDSQIQGLMSGTVNPLVRFRWSIDPQDSKPEVYEALSKEIKLPVKGKEDEFRIGRTRNRFTWAKHLPEALKMLTYGHSPFELIMEVDEAKYGDDLYHILKIIPRPPSTISQINVARDGELKGIKQFSSPFVGASNWQGPGIEAKNLLWYVWDKEGANWAGRSMLRSCFRNYVIKDMLMRIDAQKHERMGMGIPWFEAPEGASQELINALDELAEEVRAGDEAGLAVPAGAKLKLAGVEGNVPDTVASIRMHDEQMSKAFLMMFMQLGTTHTGSRALGSEMMDYFTYAQEGVAETVASKFTEDFIEQWVDWNWGEDEAVPRIVYDRSAHEDVPTEDLVKMVDGELIVMDPELEQYFRKSRGLPLKSQEQRDKEEEDKAAEIEREEKAAEQPPPVDPAAVPPPTPETVPAKAGAGRRRKKGVAAAPDAPSPDNLPDRNLRRQPYEHEVTAATDFARMDEQWNLKRDALFEAVKELQAAQVDELYDLIVAADGDLVTLSGIAVDDTTHEAILAGMQEMADEGIDQAATEAEAQGVTKAKRPKLSELEDSLTARAKAVGQILTKEMAGAAGKKAMDLTGGSLSPSEVADATKEYLNGLVKARVKDQISGAISNAQNSGRKLTMRRNDPTNIYSSELLDENTCQACTAEDGSEFGTMDEAEVSYPGGGFAECEGGERCRGTLVATYGEEAPSA
jgi:hypothetical protein